MSQELIYTSAPRGLKPGSRGFCTVVSTQGLSGGLAQRLEKLSGYRHVFLPQDANARLNPVVYSHLLVTVAGRRCHVLSRICDAGLDYTQRTNKFAHHVVLDAIDLVPAGPTWLLSQPGFMQATWDGEPKIMPTGRRPPAGNCVPAVCRAWQQLVGDAGWGGILAETAANGATRPAVLIFRPGIDPLPLLAESLALLPPESRWKVSFSTYFNELPPDVDCQWRCVLAGSPQALAVGRSSQTLIIDLCSPLGPTGGPSAQAARTGTALVAARTVQRFAGSPKAASPGTPGSARIPESEATPPVALPGREIPSPGTYSLTPVEFADPFAHLATPQVLRTFKAKPRPRWPLVVGTAVAVLISLAGFLTLWKINARETQIAVEPLVGSSNADGPDGRGNQRTNPKNETDKTESSANTPNNKAGNTTATPAEPKGKSVTEDVKIAPKNDNGGKPNERTAVPVERSTVTSTKAAKSPDNAITPSNTTAKQAGTQTVNQPAAKNDRTLSSSTSAKDGVAVGGSPTKPKTAETTRYLDGLPKAVDLPGFNVAGGIPSESKLEKLDGDWSKIVTPRLSLKHVGDKFKLEPNAKDPSHWDFTALGGQTSTDAPTPRTIARIFLHPPQDPKGAMFCWFPNDMPRDQSFDADQLRNAFLVVADGNEERVIALRKPTRVPPIDFQFLKSSKEQGLPLKPLDGFPRDEIVFEALEVAAFSGMDCRRPDKNAPKWELQIGKKDAINFIMTLSKNTSPPAVTVNVKYLGVRLDENIWTKDIFDSPDEHRSRRSPDSNWGKVHAKKPVPILLSDIGRYIQAIEKRSKTVETELADHERNLKNYIDANRDKGPDVANLRQRIQNERATLDNYKRFIPRATELQRVFEDLQETGTLHYRIYALVPRRLELYTTEQGP